MNQESVGLMGIIVKNRECTASKVNSVLSEHADVIVGRMGVPYDKKNVSFISLMIDGDANKVEKLNSQLKSIVGISVKLDLVKIPEEDGCNI